MTQAITGKSLGSRLSAAIRSCIIAVIIPFLVISSALAHSFNVAIVTPLSDPENADEVQFRNGFLLATKERDSHPDETSDGHLGGLDVYVHTIDFPTTDLNELLALLREREIDIVVPMSSISHELSRLQETDSWNSSILPTVQVTVRTAAKLSAPDPSSELETFVTAFKLEFGDQPIRVALEGYIAARRIGEAVRRLGSVADKATLRGVLELSTFDLQ